MADFSTENALIGKHELIKKRMDNDYERAVNINQSLWEEAATDTRFHAGDQSVSTDAFGLLPTSRRQQYCFNRIRRVINMISGQQRKTRKSIKVTPIENADEKTASQFTKLLMWTMQQEGGLDIISEAFHDALITGLVLIQVMLDYTKDPISGNIKLDTCPYNSFLIDPYFRKADLSDCNFIWKRSYLTKKEIKTLLPSYTQEIDNLGAPKGRDEKFPGTVETLDIGSNMLYSYDEYFYRDYRKQKLLVDLQTGESVEWTGKDDEALEGYLAKYPQVQIFESTVRTVRLAISVDGEVMYDGENPLGIDEYPFIPVFAYFAPQVQDFSWRIQGVVRGLRDPQYLYNRRKVIELDVMESRLNTAIKYKAGALIRPEDAFLIGQGRALCLNKNAAMTDVEQMVAPPLDPTMFNASATLGAEIQEISGVSEELLGSADDDKSGILSMLRQRAGLTTLQGLYDQLDRSQRFLGNVLMSVIQNNFTPGKIQRITEEQPTEEFFNKAFGRYDCVIEDGLNTSTQRQLQFAELTILKEQGVNVPSSIFVEASTVQNKQDLIKAIEQDEQQQAQMAQAKLQGDMSEQQARVHLAQSRAYADESRGHKDISQIQENEADAVERYAEAAKDRTMGQLNMVKAMKELDDIDLDQFMKFLNIMQLLKDQEQVEKIQTTQRSAVDQQASKAAMTPQPMNAGMSEKVLSGQTAGRLQSPRVSGGIT